MTTTKKVVIGVTLGVVAYLLVTSFSKKKVEIKSKFDGDEMLSYADGDDSEVEYDGNLLDAEMSGSDEMMSYADGEILKDNNEDPFYDFDSDYDFTENDGLLIEADVTGGDEIMSFADGTTKNIKQLAHWKRRVEILKKKIAHANEIKGVDGKSRIGIWKKKLAEAKLNAARLSK